jgi:hypothetical protein
MLAYADDVVILGNSHQVVGHTVEKLIASIRRMVLIINEAKTKYMLMTRHTPKNNLIVGPYIFEQVDDFKYLGVNINYKNYMHNEVKLRIISANRAYFSMNKLLSSKMLSWATKEKMKKCI